MSTTRNGCPGIFRANVKSDKPGFKEFERKGPSHKIPLGKSNVWRKVVKTFTMEYQFPLRNLWHAVEALDKSIELAERKCVYIAAPYSIPVYQEERTQFPHRLTSFMSRR